MANTFSFDVVSEVNFQEVDNAFNQAKKELSQRYDFKGSKASLDYNKADKKITLIGDDDYKLKALKDILIGQCVKRGVSLKSLTFGDPQQAFEGTLRQVAEITSGLPKEKAKEVVKIIKDFNPRVQSQIEGEKIKVSSPKKDDLQAVMAHLRQADFSLPLSFTNYR
ncbi:MAG: YajQ family cyclic di-GMP-binding protein [Omnitrophica WOR_2 bacterium GWA2_47_8]|nr:MAG: YajQ family cyclic di-GMP-binding protein [Omnitrophica WOR_2 bacterium GWA2_47_8]